MDRADEAKLKGLDPQLAAGEIIIPDGTLRDHVRYAKDEANKRGVSSIIYLKDFARGETKTITTELDRFYIHKLITLRDLKIMECQEWRLLVSYKKRLKLLLRMQSSTGIIVGGQKSCRS